jgi:hypothetical protein
MGLAYTGGNQEVITRRPWFMGNMMGQQAQGHCDDGQGRETTGCEVLADVERGGLHVLIRECPGLNAATLQGLDKGSDLPGGQAHFP